MSSLMSSQHHKLDAACVRSCAGLVASLGRVFARFRFARVRHMSFASATSTETLGE